MRPHSVFALLDTLTFPETITLVVLALLVLGPDKLPTAAKTIGIWIQKIKTVSAGLQAEVREVLDDPAMAPLKELGEFAAQPRQKLAEYARAATADEPSDVKDTNVPANPEVVAVVEDAAEHAAASAALDEAAPAVEAAPALGPLDEVHPAVEAAPTDASGEPAVVTTSPTSPVDPPTAPVESPAERPSKIVATGPNHPMERFSRPVNADEVR